MATVAGLVVAGLLIKRASPWPGALAIRWLFDRQSARVNAALLAHTPPGVSTIHDHHYRLGDPDALLDAHFPADTGADERRPTVVWIHGGAWLSGTRTNAVTYFQLIAAAGYTVVAVDYSLAPGATYPVALRQLNDALEHLCANAGRLHVNPATIILAGDSAGAQLASQLAVLTTTPGYAEAIGILPALRPDQLRGMVLHCGYYDMRTFIDRGLLAPPPFRWGIGTVVRAYTGSRARTSVAIDQMSTINHVTPAFPASLIVGGNGDPLTDAHSRPLATRLQALGVAVTTRFFDPDELPVLGHEFQFSLETAAGRAVLATTVEFLADRAGPS